ncbi:GNAT family N-acetyltransferase [Nonomuraea rubra]
MEPSPAALEVHKDETIRLREALSDAGVAGALASETTSGRITIARLYVDPDQRHRGIASALARHALSQSRAVIGIYRGFAVEYVQAYPEWNVMVDISRSAFAATRTTRNTNSGR